MVPEGWYSTKLGKVFKSRRERGHDGLPTISVTLNNGLVLRESLDRKTDTTLSPEEHLLVRTGDIAYNMMRMWQGASGLARFDALVSPAYVVLKPTKDIDPVFASYLFKSARMIHLLWAYSYGLTKDRLRLYFPDFSLIPAALPPIAEQRRIGALLSRWDRAIETTAKLITNCETQKRGLMQRLLSPTNKAFRRLRLREIALVNQHSLDSATPPDYSFRYISLSDVEGGRIAAELETYVFGRAPSRAQRKVLPGDILMSTVRPNLLGFARVTDVQTGCIASTGFAVLSTKPGFDRDYLYHYLFSAHIIGQLNALVVGSNYPAINPTDVEGLVIYCPPLAQQEKIGRILSDTDATLDALHDQRKLLKMEQNALMQQLLTGKRRVLCIEPKEVARA